MEKQQNFQTEQSLSSQDGKGIYSPISQALLHQLFEKQAKHTPKSIAVVDGNYSFTYQELNERSEILANFLRKLGVKPDTLVSIYMERSFEMIVGILGILKAGGAYVPLDPSYPQERISFMLNDARSSIVLTKKELAHTFPSICSNIIFLDEEMIYTQNEQNVVPRIYPENIAYVIYTSGSTGQPKGVLIPHKAVANHCTTIASYCLFKKMIAFCNLLLSVLMRQ
jgi:non-ribosomal peptide synthetase component F